MGWHNGHAGDDDLGIAARGKAITKGAMMDILLFGTIPGFITGMVAGWLGTMVWILWNIDTPRPSSFRRDEDEN